MNYEDYKVIMPEPILDDKDILSLKKKGSQNLETLFQVYAIIQEHNKKHKKKREPIGLFNGQLNKIPKDVFEEIEKEYG